MPTLSPSSYSVQDLSKWDDSALSKDASPPRLLPLTVLPSMSSGLSPGDPRACEVESISPDNALGCWQKMLQRTALESPSSGLAGLGTHTCLWTRAWHPAQFCKVPTCSDFSSLPRPMIPTVRFTFSSRRRTRQRVISPFDVELLVVTEVSLAPHI